jgi:hypothetical protein
MDRTVRDWAGLDRTGSIGTTLLVVPTIAALAARGAAGAAVVVAGMVAGVGSVGGVIRAPAAARWGESSAPRLRMSIRPMAIRW